MNQTLNPNFTGGTVDNKDAVIENLLTASDPMSRTNARLLATDIPNTFQKFLRQEEKSKTPMPLMMIAITELNTSILSSIIAQRMKPEFQTEMTNDLAEIFKELLTAKISEIRIRIENEKNVTA